MTTTLLYDQMQRPLRDLRISVTDRCNLRCNYCMPASIFHNGYQFLEHEELLTFEEMTRLVTIFVYLGVKKVRITGGEPLVRNRIEHLIHQLTKIEGLDDIGLTTNGVLLPSKARKLKAAGLQRVNVSLDALNQQTLQSLNGRKIDVDKVLKGIFVAKGIGMDVKVNMVVMKGVNDDQIIPMADFFKKQNIPLRFIEYMDVGCSNQWNLSRVLTKKEIFKLLSEHYNLEPLSPDYYGEVAQRYRLRDTQGEIGFIPSVSEAFCGTCTRGRLSANGLFYNCLFAESGQDIKMLLRSTKDDDTIASLIKEIWNKREDRYSELRLEEIQKPPRKKIEMSYIGG